MYVASKQRYGEDLDSFEHATEKHKGLNMYWKTVLCKSAKYALSPKAKKSKHPMNPREVGHIPNGMFLRLQFTFRGVSRTSDVARLV